MSDGLSQQELVKVLIAGILAPIVGLFGARLRDFFEARDTHVQTKREIEEVTQLVQFADTLHKAASGGSFTSVPAQATVRLQEVLARKVDSLSMQLSQPLEVRRQASAQHPSLFGRVLLLHKPRAWWLWFVHVAYYVNLGLLAAVAALVVNDFANSEPRRAVGLWVWLFLLIPCVLLNVLAMKAERRHVTQQGLAVTAQPTT
jgi:hypothetical protein